VKGGYYRNYLLLVLAVILAFDNVDRLVLGIVLQNIKLDLHLSDTALGVLTGIAFALFYSVMGVPLARWADKGDRVAIIALTTTLWGAAVILFGAAANFIQLLIVRVCVAVGEAGCLPTSLSLIADYFRASERPRAVALYLQGGSLSLLLGYFLAGWLNQFFGWRATFVAIGLPGLALAALVWFSLEEPRRAAINKRDARGAAEIRTHATTTSTAPPFREVIITLWSNRTFRHLLFFYAIMFFFNFGTVQWQPAFLIRSYGLGTGELGSWSAAVCGAGMTAGLYLGGEWASRYAADNESRQLKVMALMYCGVGLASALIYLSSSKYWAFAFMGVWTLAGASTSGPLNAMLQTLVPERMRAMAMTLVLLLANLVGMGLAPLAVGILSDRLTPLLGHDALRYALLAMTPGYWWGTWHLLQASKTVTQDMQRATRRHGLLVEES
jgi:MFS family permease